ncbi:MAG: mercury transporter MerT [Gammaproteobacteria bacterium]|nr:mercury transporter MerT [Gammaproteobacteria bacterium]
MSESPINARRSLLLATLAAMGASACCAGPLILLGLGISGSWIGNLSLMEPLRPYFIAITVIIFALAYRKLYRVKQDCDIDAPCADTTNIRKQRRVFWISLALAVLIITFPEYAPYLLE